MSKVIAIMSMSLDGYVADRNGSVAEVMGWYMTSGTQKVRPLGRRSERERELAIVVRVDGRLDRASLSHRNLSAAHLQFSRNLRTLDLYSRTSPPGPRKWHGRRCIICEMATIQIRFCKV